MLSHAAAHSCLLLTSDPTLSQQALLFVLLSYTNYSHTSPLCFCSANSGDELILNRKISST